MLCLEMCSTSVVSLSLTSVHLLQEGKLALHWAAQFGEMEVFHKLLNGRQSLQAVDGCGNLALHLAAAAGQM